MAVLRRRTGFLIAMLAILVGAPVVGAEQIGEVVVSRGATTAQNGAQAARLLGKKAPIANGDVVTTGKKSFVVLKMSDGTKMSLRPNTIFKVENWDATPQAENVALRLFKGGLRAITGAISKRNQSAFRLRTSVATIGIRGTTFDARLCENDCGEEAQRYKAVAAPVSKVVGRVGFLKGSASASQEEASDARGVTIGAPLYEGDAIVTQPDSFAVLLFNDRSRVTLRANSEFRIESLSYGTEKEESAFFRLVRGGLRAVSGAIGKRNPHRVKFRTAVATIGIRGTGFDLVCQEDTAIADAAALSPARVLHLIGKMMVPDALAAADTSGPGCFVTPWEGAITVELPAGEFVVEAGQIVFVPEGASEPVFLPNLPMRIQEPRPDAVEMDESALLDSVEQDEVQPGLYLACHEGYCLVGDKPLGEGETAYTSEGGEKTIRLKIIPQFLNEDQYFKLTDVDSDVFGLFSTEDGPQVLECTF